MTNRNRIIESYINSLADELQGSAEKNALSTGRSIITDADSIEALLSYIERGKIYGFDLNRVFELRWLGLVYISLGLGGLLLSKEENDIISYMLIAILILGIILSIYSITRYKTLKAKLKVKMLDLYLEDISISKKSEPNIDDRWEIIKEWTKFENNAVKDPKKYNIRRSIHELLQRNLITKTDEDYIMISLSLRNNILHTPNFIPDKEKLSTAISNLKEINLKLQEKTD